MAHRSSPARAIAAFLFVAVFAAVLTIPLRGTEDEAEPGRRIASPSVLPSPSRSSLRFTLRPSSFPRSKRFVTRFPRSCLQPVEASGGDGLVAAADRGRVTIASLGGQTIASFRAAPPVAFSPSGLYIAAGPQGLFWRSDGSVVLFSNDEFAHGMVTGRRGLWGWSPTADCGVAIEDGRLYATSIDPRITNTGVDLVNRGVESFAFSPDGRMLGMVTRAAGPRSPASIWIADLQRSRMEEVRRFPRPTCCIILGGWTPDARYLLHWAGPGTSVMADGWTLEGVDRERRLIRLTPGRRRGRLPLRSNPVPRPEAVEMCGERVIAVLGGARFLNKATRISVVYPKRDAETISSGEFSDVQPTCSPGGDSVVAARAGAVANPPVDPTRVLVLLEPGSVGDLSLGNLTPIAGPSEEWPEWGSDGAGIVFVQRDLEIGLWHLPEGSTTANPLGLLVGPSVERSWDWSATPPTGLPGS